MKLCKDCKFFRGGFLGWLFRPLNCGFERSVVHGGPYYSPCSIMRAYSHLCGEKGNHFQEKTK